MPMNKRKDINLYEALKEARQHSKDTTRSNGLFSPIAVILPAAVLLAAAAINVGVLYHKMNTESRYNEVQEQLEDDEISATNEYANLLLQNFNELESGILAVSSQDFIKTINSERYTGYSSELISLINSKTTKKISITGFVVSDSSAVIEFTADSGYEVAPFVKRLRETNAFTDISYTGYSGTEGKYFAAITAYLA